MADYKSIMKKIKKALISVSDKKDLGLLLKKLTKFKIDIISSGGTFKEIKKLGYKCTELSKYTGSVFSKSGISLTSNIPWYNKIGDNITVTGTVTDGKSDVMVFLLPLTGGNSQVDNSNKTVTASNSSFDFSYTIPSITAGSYLLGISSSTNGSWSYNNAPLIVIY